MKKLSIVGLLIALLAGNIAKSQTFEERSRAIAERIDSITTTEKNALKDAVLTIDEQLEKREITSEEANEEKRRLAEFHAEKINNEVAKEEEKLAQLVQDKVDGKVEESKHNRFGPVTVSVGGKGEACGVDSLGNKKYKSEKRTTTQLVFAVGLNNSLIDGEFNDEYRGWGSKFYEFGWSWKTRLTKESTLLNLKYGASLVYNNFSPKDDQYFITNNELTTLETAPFDVDKTRFRNFYVTIPVYLEFDFSKPKFYEGDENPYLYSQRGFRFGLGGYAGVLVNSKQIMKYEFDDKRIKHQEKGDFNANGFQYGLGAYIGFRTMSLYAKYDLQPVFADNPIEENNISFGLRFDFN